MFRSRAVKTLSALVAAMTVGAILLMLMETSPVRPPSSHFAAVAEDRTDSLDVVLETKVPFQPLKWRNIIVHCRPHPAGKLIQGCHFVVDMRDPGGAVTIQRTARWEDQADGRHVFVRGVNWNDSSIGVCLIGDFSRRPPRARQIKGLVNLATRLQELFGIPRDNVYLAGDIGQAATSPGRAFPRQRFEGQLLRTVP